MTRGQEVIQDIALLINELALLCNPEYTHPDKEKAIVQNSALVRYLFASIKYDQTVTPDEIRTLISTDLEQKILQGNTHPNTVAFYNFCMKICDEIFEEYKRNAPVNSLEYIPHQTEKWEHLLAVYHNNTPNPLDLSENTKHEVKIGNLTRAFEHRYIKTIKPAQFKAYQESLSLIKDHISSLKRFSFSSVRTKKIEALEALLKITANINFNNMTKASEFSDLAQQIISWKQKNDAVLGTHRIESIGLTDSQIVVNYLISDLEPLAVDKNITQYCEYQKYLAQNIGVIQNKIYWLNLSLLPSKSKIDALQSFLNDLVNITNSDIATLDQKLIAIKNNAILQEHRTLAKPVPTESQTLINNLIINLSPVVSNEAIKKYSAYQAPLAMTIKKINSQLIWLNFYSTVCWIFQWVGTSTTLEVVNKKIDAFKKLLGSIYNIEIDKPSKFKNETLIEWKSHYSATINTHTYSSEKTTKSQAIIEELDNHLENIENPSHQKLIN